jgi:DNA-binding transcriptional MerR regulator
MTTQGLTVSRLARLAGVSVRTLHHYDEIGLLKPTGRGPNGYRLYARAQLQRLQQILFYRELDFPLEEIIRMMSDPAFDVYAALLEQKALLVQRAERTSALIEAIEKALKGVVVFDAFEKEAEQRWGDTEQYKESKRRTARYGQREWDAVKAEWAAIHHEFALLMDAKVAAGDPKAMAMAERHRAHISKWFYECTYEIHRGLAELYVADERFMQNLDAVRPGLAAFQRAAILANAERSGTH